MMVGEILSINAMEASRVKQGPNKTQPAAFRKERRQMEVGMGKNWGSEKGRLCPTMTGTV